MLPGLRTPNGALFVTTAAPTADDVYSGGVRMTPAGVIRVNGNTPQRFDQGKGFMNNGALCVDLSGISPVVGHVGGLPVTALGAIKVQFNQDPSVGDAYVGRIRVGPLGGVYVVDTTPLDPEGFSTGFSEGFGA
jgi:hypothetical protein